MLLFEIYLGENTQLLTRKRTRGAADSRRMLGTLEYPPFTFLTPFLVPFFQAWPTTAAGFLPGFYIGWAFLCLSRKALSLFGGELFL